jgi:hypothetical protein
LTDICQAGMFLELALVGTVIPVFAFLVTKKHKRTKTLSALRYLYLFSHIFKPQETVSGSLLECNLYLQVIAMEPSDEPVLRVNKTLTALVLAGSCPSALPPDLLTTGPEGPVPLQIDTVKILASILAPTLCPSALSSKFKVSVLLYCWEGVFYIAWLCFLIELVFIYFFFTFFIMDHH